MRKILAHILTVLTILIPVYLIMSFISLHFNPLYWSTLERAIFFFSAMFVIATAIDIYKEEGQ